MVCAAFRHRKGMQAKADETELPQAQAGLKSPSSATSKGNQFSCNRAGYSCAQEVWRQLLPASDKKISSATADAEREAECLHSISWYARGGRRPNTRRRVRRWVNVPRSAAYAPGFIRRRPRSRIRR